MKVSLLQIKTAPTPEENIIKISVKNGFITFLGNEFKISTFSDEQLSFSGFITSVEFSV